MSLEDPDFSAARPAVRRLPVVDPESSTLASALDNFGGPVKFWESVVDLLSDAVFLVGPDRRVLFWNRAAERLTGTGRADAIGQHCLHAIHCEPCETQCGVFELGEIHDVPMTVRTLDRRTLEVVKSGTVMRGPGGAPLLGIEVLRDVTASNRRESVATEARIAAEGQRELLRSILDSVTDGVVGIGVDGAVTFVSAAAERVLGVRASEAVGAPVERVTGAPLAALVRRAIERVEPTQAERALIEKETEPIPVEVSVSPMSLPCGSHGALLNLVDLREHERRAREGLTAKGFSYGAIVSRSPRMREVFELIDHVAPSLATILISGESGTGKELVAREIHKRSRRAAGPFHAVSCAAIAPELLESEFFGHERGAFTGAVHQKPGRFEVAHGGTIFLDEVAELPLELQSKLLRVIEERSFERVGGTKPIQVDVRIVAATHRDLGAMVACGRFREDLYYRLRVVPLTLPPLRERVEDIQILAEHLLARISERDASDRRSLSADAIASLERHTWPGNVRELANVMEYAAVISRHPLIQLGDLPHELRPREPPKAPDAGSRVALTSSAPPDSDRTDERARIERALLAAHYRSAEAARVLGMHRTTLYRKRLQYGL
ncbi:MAG: sigma 54-interacting transcriptional regulator [Deltaproteobacteria bacterium]|nr:sigma 54-interacting transcriptional regulator [Deltaproteobacteria bacterium]